MNQRARSRKIRVEKNRSGKRRECSIQSTRRKGRSSSNSRTKKKPPPQNRGNTSGLRTGRYHERGSTLKVLRKRPVKKLGGQIISSFWASKGTTPVNTNKEVTLIFSPMFIEKRDNDEFGDARVEMCVNDTKKHHVVQFVKQNGGWLWLNRNRRNGTNKAFDNDIDIENHTVHYGNTLHDAFWECELKPEGFQKLKIRVPYYDLMGAELAEFERPFQELTDYQQCTVEYQAINSQTLDKHNFFLPVIDAENKKETGDTYDLRLTFKIHGDKVSVEQKISDSHSVEETISNPHQLPV